MKSAFILLSLAILVCAVVALIPTVLFWALATLGIVTVPLTPTTWAATLALMLLCGLFKIHVRTS